MTPDSQAGVWVAFVVLWLGTAAIVALAAAAQRLVRSAVGQRATWQAAVAAILGLVVVEISGAAPAAVGLVRHWLPERDAAAIARISTSAVAGLIELPAAAQREASRSDAAAPADLFVVPASAGASAVPASTELLPPEGGTTNDLPPEGGTTNRAADVRGSARGAGWLAVIWACGAVLLAVRTVHGRLLLGRFRRCGVMVTDPSLLGRLAGLRQRLGIDRPVTVLESAVLSAPVAFGSRRPAIALPVGFARDFDAAQQEAMLAHELAHLAAGDSAWQLAAEAVAAMLWWHPAAWWARSRLRAAAEVAADEASLLVPDGPDVLAGCLVALGRRLTRTRRLGWVAMEGAFFRSGLGRRVERLLNLREGPARAAPRRWPAVGRRGLPAMMLAVAICCTAWARPQAGFAEGETTMKVLKSSLGRSLAAVTLAAVLSPVGWGADAAGPPDRPPRPDEAVGDAERPREVDRERPEAPRRETEEPRRETAPAARRGDREGPREPSPEAQLLRRQIEVLRMAVPALREAERRDALEILERAIHARELTLAGRRDDEAREIRERAPAPGQLAEILRTAAELWREFNDAEKAEAVRRLADELVKPQDRPREGERGEGERERPRGPEQREMEERERRAMADRERREREEITQGLIRERDELRERANNIERELRGLRDDQDEEARELRGALERTAAEIRQIEARLHELSQRREGRPAPPPHGPPPAARDEFARRLQHLRVAVENLRAAGLHEQAERLMREGERFMHEARGREGDRDVPPPQPLQVRRGPRPGDREVPPPPSAVEEELHGVIRQLHGQLDQMRRQMEEMRQKMERMAAPRGEGEKREL